MVTCACAVNGMVWYGVHVGQNGILFLNVYVYVRANSVRWVLVCVCVCVCVCAVVVQVLS